MALIVDDITCVYASGTSLASRALAGVSLHVEPGELVLVVGPTGSGKTTLLRAIAGLLPLASGSIMLDDSTVDSPAARGAVGLVFQRPEAQFFALTVEEDCAFGPRNFGRTRDEAIADAHAALSDVGLDPAEFAAREPWSLSGGEARRAAIAGVLAMRPRYLLMDEPTAGLDSSARDAVCGAIARARAHTGLVIVTHDAELFVRDADRVLVLEGGGPVYAGDVAGWLQATASRPTAALEPLEVVRAQVLAAARGARPSRLTSDPLEAAAMLVAARGGEGS